MPVRARVRRLAALTRLLAAALLVPALACGGDEDQPAPPTPGASDGPVQVRGGERFGWNQSADTVAELQQHQFILHVDGAPRPVEDLRCGDVRGPSGYECSGRLPTLAPGQHVLAVSARWLGAESAPSAPLVVRVAAAGQTFERTLDTLRTPDSSLTITTCVPPAAPDCYDARPVASGLTEVAAMATANDGRVFLIEQRTRVRVLEQDRLVAEPVLTVQDPGERIVGLAVDPRFNDTRIVYVASTLVQDGRTELSVSKYRELRNVLGQRAVIVSGLEIPADTLVPLAADPEGFLYLAHPAHPAADDDEGRILRLTGDGYVPRSNPAGSPVIAAGLADPMALVIEPDSGRGWIAGRDSSGRSRVTAFATGEQVGTTMLPVLVGRGTLIAPGTLRHHLATVAEAPDRRFLFIVSDGALSRREFLPDGRISAPQVVPLEVEIRVAVGGPLGSLYTVAQSSTGSEATILRLMRQAGR